VSAEKETSGAVGPVRVQLRRTKGWRMPPNTVKATRPGKLGNPLTIANAIECGFATKETAQAFVVEAFEDWLLGGRDGRDWWQGRESDKARAAIVHALPDLRGKNLACWCALDKPCHADVLLKIANSNPPHQEHANPTASPGPSDAARLSAPPQATTTTTGE